MAQRLGLLLSALVGTPFAKKPHIIHIMADDVGWNDLGYHGQTPCRSPNLDRLALDGVRMTRHYAFKVCGPSRSAFQSGRLPWQMGYYDNSGAATPWEQVDSHKLGLSLNFTLLPEVLRDAGYDTHAIGKWHCGHVMRAYTPTYRGYSTFLGYYDACTHDYWAHTHSVPGKCKGPGLGGEWNDMSDNTDTALQQSSDNGTYESVLFGDRAISLIDERASSGDGKPLFLYLAFHNEHDPHQAPREAIDEFESSVKSDTYKITCAQIWTMDQEVGRIVEALNRTGMLEDTIISFTSDNGGPLDHANNWPHRGGKHTVYEGGIRSQAFTWSASMPEVARGTTYAGLMHLADWRSTYALGAVGLPKSAVIDQGPFGQESVNHWAAIMGQTSEQPRKEIIHTVWSKHYPGNCTIDNWEHRGCPAVITSGDLKLIMGFAGDPRVLKLDEDTGGKAVVFGQTGGKCGLAGFAERCESKGFQGEPKPKPDDPDGCLYGCLFDISADVSESNNLINETAYAADVQRLKEALAAAGEIAPPWFQTPEVADLSPKKVQSALCDAAKAAGGAQPIDFRGPRPTPSPSPPPSPSPSPAADQCTKASGILHKDGVTCCPASCGACGGKDCGKLPGGHKNCCSGGVKKASRDCRTDLAPCSVSQVVAV